MRYAAKRLATLLLTMVIVSLLTFAAFDLISGSPATAMLGTSATPEKVAALEAELGLDRPLPVRYGEWIAGFAAGDLGISYSYLTPVSDLIAQPLLTTLCLSLLTFCLIVAVSIPVGLWAARRPGGGWAGSIANQLLMALPPFFVGMLLTWVFSSILGWFVHGRFPGLREDPAGALAYLLFPAAALALPRIAMTVRMLSATLRSEMGKDYVRTAISRGNDRRGVLVHHVLKNALVPVVTFLGQTMAEIVAGSIVVEQVFAVPGLGRMLLTSIGNRDYPVVQAIVVILALWVVLAGAAADWITQWIDPRLRLGGAQ